MESSSSRFDEPLDNPAYASLAGPHAALAERSGDVLRYPPEISPFIGMPDDPGPADWAAAAAFVGPGGLAVMPARYGPFPDGWEVLAMNDGVQMVAESLEPAADPEAVPLGPHDVPEMLDLVERTKPGPFAPRTIELGTYLGIRREGKLVAMAGERMRPPGYTEISAVCTDGAWRGHGFAARLTRAVAVGIVKRGDTPFLHAVATNTNAIRLYEKMGFVLRRTTVFPRARAPKA
ncbi:MAG: GNAT family N-acetyltransferase [Streptosporangiales bacterium]|nr:GNAT family N-acetyltransferase [Streptosporangiales bacterium]